MIPLIGEEITRHGWIMQEEFANIVAVSQMTPGPIAVNAATYIGFKVAGIWGSAFATLGVSLPSFILVIVVAKFFEKLSNSKYFEGVLSGIRPATIGLIAAAVWFFADMSIFVLNEASKLPLWLENSSAGSFFQTIKINPAALLIFLVILIGTKKFKLHPIAAVALSALLGLLIL